MLNNTKKEEKQEISKNKEKNYILKTKNNQEFEKTKATIKKCLPKIIIAIVIIIGIFVRTYKIDKYPNALNVDEASAGYEAFSIMNYGIDRNGKFMPVFLVAWGSGQNALLTYLIIPFIAIFGLTTFAIRLPMAIIGGISLFIFYLLLKRITNKKIATIGLIFLAICPWHIMKSRWGLESNLFPDLILLSIFLIIKGLQDKRKIFQILGYIIAGITAYSYGTSYFFLPLFFIPILYMLVKKKEITIKQAILNLLIIAIISLPIIIFVIINSFDLPAIKLPFMTIPRMEVNRYEEVTSIFSSEFIKNSIQNFLGSINILIAQIDGLEWNSIWPYGTIYIFSSIFTIIGIITAIKSRKEIKYGYFMGTWLIVSILLTFICEPNINRLNIIFFPIIFYTTIGIYEIIKMGKKYAIIIALIYMLSFAGFLNTYTKQDANTYGTFEANLEEPIKYLKMLENKKIYITNSIKEPYIYVLFYSQYSAKDFVCTVEYYNPGEAFRQVKKFGQYNFLKIEKIEKNAENVYILKTEEFEKIKEEIEDIEEFDIKEFEGYVIITY